MLTVKKFLAILCNVTLRLIEFFWDEYRLGVQANESIPVYTVDSSNPHQEYATFTSLKLINSKGQTADAINTKRGYAKGNGNKIDFTVSVLATDLSGNSSTRNFTMSVAEAAAEAEDPEPTTDSSDQADSAPSDLVIEDSTQPAEPTQPAETSAPAQPTTKPTDSAEPRHRQRTLLRLLQTLLIRLLRIVANLHSLLIPQHRLLARLRMLPHRLRNLPSLPHRLRPLRLTLQIRPWQPPTSILA